MSRNNIKTKRVSKTPSETFTFADNTLTQSIDNSAMLNDTVETETDSKQIQQPQLIKVKSKTPMKLKHHKQKPQKTKTESTEIITENTTSLTSLETIKHDTETANEIRSNVQGTFDLTAHAETDEQKEWSAHDTQKIILMKALAPEHLMDLTCLSDDEIEDIENARMLNMIGNNPLVENVCNDHMHLKRSTSSGDPRSLMQHLFDWSTRSINNLSDATGITRVLGRKGSN